MAGKEYERTKEQMDGQVRGTRRGISDTWASGDWDARSRLRGGALLARFGGAPLASNVYWRDLNLIAGFVRGRDTSALFELHEEEHGEEDEHAETEELELRFEEAFTYKGWFTELDYVFLPWLHGGFRYEWLDPPRPGRESFERVTVNGTALVRANVKALIEYQRNIGGAEVDDYMFLWRLRFAF